MIIIQHHLFNIDARRTHTAVTIKYSYLVCQGRSLNKRLSFAFRLARTRTFGRKCDALVLPPPPRLRRSRVAAEQQVAGNGNLAPSVTCATRTSTCCGAATTAATAAGPSAVPAPPARCAVIAHASRAACLGARPLAVHIAIIAMATAATASRVSQPPRALEPPPPQLRPSSQRPSTAHARCPRSRACRQHRRWQDGLVLGDCAGSAHCLPYRDHGLRIRRQGGRRGRQERQGGALGYRRDCEIPRDGRQPLPRCNVRDARVRCL